VIVLDTNVLSELMKRRPDRAVLRWFAQRSAASLFTTTISEAEIRYGVALLPDGKRKRALAHAVAEMFGQDLRGRTLPFDSPAAASFAVIAVHRRALGRPISQLDAQIAAIARSQRAALATRNLADFQECGVELENPWGIARGA